MNWLRKEQGAGAYPIKTAKGQVAIESTIGLVAVIIFLLGITQVFLWINRTTINRQRAYQESRTELGRIDSEEFYLIDEANAGRQLRVFPQER